MGGLTIGSVKYVLLLFGGLLLWLISEWYAAKGPKYKILKVIFKIIFVAYAGVFILIHISILLAPVTY